MHLATVGELELAHSGEYARAAARLGPLAGQIGREPVPRCKPSAIEPGDARVLGNGDRHFVVAALTGVLK
jgi:hypothetical protein